MKKSHLLGALCAAVFSFISLPSQAAFVSVLGGQAFYDDQLDITWTANANINGQAFWDDQMAWVAGLDIDGVTGWRLPSMDVDGNNVIDTCTSGQTACKDNEYGHLFYYGAGTVYGGGITPTSPGTFINVMPELYWSGTANGVNPANKRAFWFGGSGGQGWFNKDGSEFYAWAVRTGGSELVSGVPIPPALWLFGSGLLGLVGMAGRKKVV